MQLLNGGNRHQDGVAFAGTDSESGGGAGWFRESAYEQPASTTAASRMVID